MYTIIDVETTGRTNRITEIAIFKYSDGKILEEFSTLVNPEESIPPHITSLTGIDNAMLVDAPVFSEIAQEISKMTEDAIFVAHNVNFDFNVIRGEFNRLKIPFRRRKLCTVRLARKLLPGLKSYSLGKLCASVGISITDRHRARGDAEATVKLFELMEAQSEAAEVFERFLKASSRQATLPAHLSDEVFNAIPEAPGIYYFLNKKGQIIYVGKSINLKKRVLSHFYNKKQKELDLCRETAHIETELSGSDLVALLMEEAAIKKHYPIYNVASKKTPKTFGIFTYIDRLGILHFAINTQRMCPEVLQIFYNKRDAVVYLEYICEAFDLCPKYCNIQQTPGACNHYKIKTCKGICVQNESIALYNARVRKAVNYIKERFKNNIIKKPGRSLDEEGFVWVKEGIYQGYGFISKTEQIAYTSDLENYLIPQKDTYDVQRILRKELLSHC